MDTETADSNISFEVKEKLVDKSVEKSVDKKEAPKEIILTDIPITNENIALNVLVSFLNLGQRRGAFNIQESAKIWECISKFQRP